MPFIAPFPGLMQAQKAREKLGSLMMRPFVIPGLQVQRAFAGPAAPQDPADNANGQKNQCQKFANPHLDRKQVSAAVNTGPLGWIASETRL